MLPRTSLSNPETGRPHAVFTDPRVCAQINRLRKALSFFSRESRACPTNCSSISGERPSALTVFSPSAPPSSSCWRSCDGGCDKLARAISALQGHRPGAGSSPASASRLSCDHHHGVTMGRRFSGVGGHPVVMPPCCILTQGGHALFVMDYRAVVWLSQGNNRSPQAIACSPHRYHRF